MNGFNLIISVLFICFFTTYSYSQSSISGLIKDEYNLPLEGISIGLKKKSNDKVFIQFQYTDNSGYFKFSELEKNEYILEISSINYEKENLNVKLDDDFYFEKELNPKAISLQEIVVEAIRPVVIKKDTIVFDAEYFSDNNTDTLEDLISNLPGFRVDSEGKITVSNTEIENIMIEGDNLFDKNYQILSRNMKSYSVDKVELIQNYNENELYKGIINSENIAVNIKLKDDFFDNWFGNAELGSSTYDREQYYYKTNLIHIESKFKLVATSTYNNLGNEPILDFNKDTFNEISKQFNYSLSYPTGLNYNKLLPIRYLPTLEDEDVRFNDNFFNSLGSNYTLSDKTKLRLLAFYNSDNLENNTSVETKFNDDKLLPNKESNSNKNSIKDFYIQSKLESNLTEKSKLVIDLNVFNKNERNTNHHNFNKLSIFENERINLENIDNLINYTIKTDSTRIYEIKNRTSYNKSTQNYNSDNFLFNELFSDENKLTTLSKGDNKTFLNSTQVKLTERLSKSNLISVLIGSNISTTDTENNINADKKEDNLFENNFQLQSLNPYAGLSYKYSFNKSSLSINAYLHYLQLKRKELKHNSEPKTFKKIAINPSVKYTYNLNQNNKISLQYSYSNSLPPFGYYFNDYYLNRKSNLLISENEFELLDNSNFRFSYSYNNWRNNFNVLLFSSYRINHKYTINNTSVHQNFVQTKLGIANNGNQIFNSISVEKFINSLRTNFKLNLTHTRNKSKSIVNSKLNNNKQTSLNYSVEARSGFRGLFNFQTGFSNSRFNFSNNSLDNTINTNSYFLDLYFEITKKINLSTNYKLIYINNLENKINLLKLMITYKINNKWTVESSLRNILNNKYFSQILHTDIYSSESTNQLQSRAFFITAKFNF